MSQILQSTNRSAERGALLREALRILDLHPESDLTTLIRALRQLSLFEHDAQDPRALDHARRAVELSETLESPNELIEALTVLGNAQANFGDNAGAERTLQRAVELSSKTPDFHRRQRIILIAYLGDVQIALDNFAAAEANFRDGLDLAMKVSGPDHIDVAQMEKRLGQLLFDTGRTAEGLRLLQSAHGRVVRIKGANDRSFLPRIMRSESSMEADLGDLEAALPLVDEGLRLLGAAPDRNLVSHLQLKAEILLELGRVADARATLERLDAYEREKAVIRSDRRDARSLLAARLLFYDNRRDEARAALAAALTDAGDQRHSSDEWNRLLKWAELSFDLGDVQSTSTIAEAALKQIVADPAPGYLGTREAIAATLAGKVRLAHDDVAAAIPLLQRAVVLAETHFYVDRSPRLADAEIALAEAYRRTGQAMAARQALAKAEAILAHHPSLAGGHRMAWDETRKRLAMAR